MSLFGPAMAQAKSAFLNKNSRSISFNSVFKNGGLKTSKRQGSVFLKTHDFKSQVAILKANRDFTKYKTKQTTCLKIVPQFTPPYEFLVSALIHYLAPHPFQLLA
jgi:hypothetical protein